MKNSAWKTYAIWILLTEAVGAISGWLTKNGVKEYNATVIQPPLSPPAVVFPIVWSILFALMGVGAAKIQRAALSPMRTKALRIFGVQLAFNFLWSIIFFNFQAFGLAFAWLLALWGLILKMIFTFRKVDRTAALLQIPYLLWVTFAAYLNLGVWLLNK